MGEYKQDAGSGMVWNKDGDNTECWSLFGCELSAGHSRERVRVFGGAGEELEYGGTLERG